MRAFPDASPGVKWFVLRALVTIMPSERTSTLVRRSTSDPDVNVRRVAVELCVEHPDTIGRLSVNSLIARLADREEYFLTRQDAARALTQVCGATPSLVEFSQLTRSGIPEETQEIADRAVDEVFAKACRAGQR